VGGRQIKYLTDCVTSREIDMLTKKNPTRYRVFSRMCRAATAESILIKFGTSTPWADVVIYLKRHPNWSKGWGGGGVRNFAYPIDFAIGF